METVILELTKNEVQKIFNACFFMEQELRRQREVHVFIEDTELRERILDHATEYNELRYKICKLVNSQTIKPKTS